MHTSQEFIEWCIERLERRIQTRESSTLLFTTFASTGSLIFLGAVISESGVRLMPLVIFAASFFTLLGFIYREIVILYHEPKDYVNLNRLWKKLSEEKKKVTEAICDPKDGRLDPLALFRAFLARALFLLPLAVVGVLIINPPLDNVVCVTIVFFLIIMFLPAALLTLVERHLRARRDP